MNKDLKASLTWGVGLIALALAAVFARQQGYIDQDAVTRIVMGATGLAVAWYGNRLPKAFVEGAIARKVARIGGRSMALSGLIYGGLWALAPIELALLIGCAAVAGGILFTMGYCFALRRRTRAT